jgi:peptidoglycan/LPS O-acetylase OafA/YrhL
LKQIDQLTFTRFVAAVTVVYYHYGLGLFPFNHKWVEQFFLVGHISVSFFYALSGFIMAVVYYKDECRSFRKVKYWQARFARIYPVYLIALISSIWLLHPRHDLPRKKIFSALMIQSWIPGYPMSYNFPGWSVSVEVSFYLLFPFLIVAFSRASLKKVLIAVGLFWFSSNLLHIVANHWLQFKAPCALYDFLFYLPVMHLNAFLAGMAAGIVYLKHGHLLVERQKVNRALLAGSATIIGLILLNRNLIEHELPVKLPLSNGLMAPLFLVFIIALSCDRGVIARLFSRKGAVLLGDASYSMYILHVPIFLSVQKLITVYHLNYTKTEVLHVYVVIVVAVSLLSYLFIEKPARSWLRQLFDSKLFASRKAAPEVIPLAGSECRNSLS